MAAGLRRGPRYDSAGDVHQLQLDAVGIGEERWRSQFWKMPCALRSSLRREGRRAATPLPPLPARRSAPAREPARPLTPPSWSEAKRRTTDFERYVTLAAERPPMKADRQARRW